LTGTTRQARRPSLKCAPTALYPAPVHRVRPAVDELVTHFVRDRRRGEIRDLELIPWGGAIGRTPPDATAFVHRTARFMLKSTVQVSYRADGRRRVAAYRWLARSWQITHPWGSGGIYPNYPDPYLADWARAYYGSNLDRLRRIKAAYDPQNFFRYAQSL
jgi:FAD/FMN-containing dehydrogenase